jgi:crotonobetainyl-CoA:carnitine CoA-transferase CaiB-like acyl-CoA transferase
VRTSLLESMIAMMDFQATRWTIDRQVPGQAGNHHPMSVPMGCFATADGYVNVGAAGGRLLHAFCSVIGLPGLPDDPRFGSYHTRSANRAELNALVAERLRAQPTSYWVDALNQAGVPCGPVYRMDEVFADPQVRHLEMAHAVQHPELGPLEMLRSAVQMTGTSAGTARTPAPERGDHADEVLASLGYSPAEVAGLRADGVI